MRAQYAGDNMNNKMKFFITDVFAEQKYSGNQLATCLSPPSLSDDEMQQIAHEIHFSETTFILSDTPRNGGYDVRIFTPGAEIDFAGHPTLGTAFLIHQLFEKESREVILNLKVGQIPVSFQEDDTGQDMLWMKQAEPTFGETLRADRLAQVLNIDIEEIDPQWPIQEVSTGLPHIIVPLITLKALKKVSISLEAYENFIANTEAKIILVFSPEGYSQQQDLSVRVFPIYYGISEDPATGSGAGCLAGYLVKQRYWGSDSIDITSGQGYEIGRPSSLYLHANENDGVIHASVGGKVIPIAEGWWG